MRTNQHSTTTSKLQGNLAEIIPQEASASLVADKKISWPRISLITPVYNQVDYVEQTIRSVLSQAYPNLEYIIIDGGSTDGTVECIKKYEKHLTYWTSEPDEGMYHALQKGMERTSGEIMSWINADDLLYPMSLFTVGEIFHQFPDIRWLQGCQIGYDEYGRALGTLNVMPFSKYNVYLTGDSRIQQETTFWRRSLWQEAGGKMDLQYKYAAEFELWLRFFRFEKLYMTTALLGGFRHREGQLSQLRKEAYTKELNSILEKELKRLSPKEQRILGRLKFIKAGKPYIGMRIGTLLMRWMIKRLGDQGKVIQYDHSQKKFIPE